MSACGIKLYGVGTTLLIPGPHTYRIYCLLVFEIDLHEARCNYLEREKTLVWAYPYQPSGEGEHYPWIPWEAAFRTSPCSRWQWIFYLWYVFPWVPQNWFNLLFQNHAPLRDTLPWNMPIRVPRTWFRIAATLKLQADLKRPARLNIVNSIHMLKASLGNWFSRSIILLIYSLSSKNSLCLTRYYGGETDPAAVESHTATLQKKLDAYEKILSKRKYLAGDVNVFA